jgi:hypothetical protein
LVRLGERGQGEKQEDEKADIFHRSVSVYRQIGHRG